MRDYREREREREKVLEAWVEASASVSVYFYLLYVRTRIVFALLIRQIAICWFPNEKSVSQSVAVVVVELLSVFVSLFSLFCHTQNSNHLRELKFEALQQQKIATTTWLRCCTYQDLLFLKWIRKENINFAFKWIIYQDCLCVCVSCCTLDERIIETAFEESGVFIFSLKNLNRSSIYKGIKIEIKLALLYLLFLYFIYINFLLLLLLSCFRKSLRNLKL